MRRGAVTAELPANWLTRCSLVARGNGTGGTGVWRNAGPIEALQRGCPPSLLPPPPLQPVPPLSSCAPPAFTPFIRLLRELNETGRQTLTRESKHTVARTYLEPPHHLLFGFILKLTFNV